MGESKLTLRDIYQVVNERFDRLEDKVDFRFAGHEKRLNSMETEVATLKGKASVLSVIGSYLISIASMALQFIRRN